MKSTSALDQSSVYAAETRSSPDRPRRAAPHQLKNYFNIIYALMMHDIKNRFFGSGLGQIVMVLWPFVHILVLIAIYAFTKRPTPYGNSLTLYSAVSVYPFMCYNYTMKWVVYSALTNKNFLQYAIIKPMDILIARSALEIVSITLVGILLIIFVICAGADPMPYDHAQAVYALCAALFLSIGFGFCNAAIAFIIPIWNVFVTFTIIGAYISSGILFQVSKMPEKIKTPLSYNPVLHCVEWMRIAYYSDYPTDVLDKTYIFEFGLCSLTLGIIMIKLLQRFY